MRAALTRDAVFPPPALIVAGREIRDQLRDWRILLPIALLTLFFPFLMNVTARGAVDFVARYGAPLVGERLVPFLLMVVGFFPISISLVIALESFAGERERLSLEPLLATPLTDSQLYLGKMLASLVAPLGAAYLGIAVYLISLWIGIHWLPSPALLTQVLLLTTAQALVMVNGAVVISLQTTSVRAANLLASFIIVPVSQLIIGESLIMFWGLYDVLWWIILALLALTGLLCRMGLHLFNRESILGREIDTLNLRLAWTGFTQALCGDARGPLDWYRGLLRQTLPRMRMPLLVQCGAIVAAYLIGQSQAARFPLPAEMLRMGQLEGSAAEQLLRFEMLNGSGWMWVISNNLRAMGLATLLGAFSFGVASIVLNMAPMAIIGYFAGNVAMAGQSVFKFLLALVIPHAILEIPAAILGGAAMLRLGMVIVSPPQGRSLGQNWVIALAEWARVFVGLVVPLLIGAAALEVFVTPRVALLLLHG